MASGIPINIRIKPEEMDKIMTLVDAGYFTDRSEFIHYAIRMALAQDVDPRTRSPVY